MGRESERTLIAGRQPHDDDVLDVLDVWLARQDLHRLVVDNAGIWVVYSTVSAEEQLRVLVLAQFWAVLVQQLTKLVVRVDHSGDTLGGVEASDLNDVVALGPLELVHLFLGAQGAELAHVVLRVPGVEVLVETIEPREKSVS